MKTTVPKLSKAATPKAITPAVASDGELLSEDRLSSSDAEGRAATVYWTIKQIGGQPPKAWRISHQDPPPHSQVCSFQYGILKTLVRCLEDKGWKRRDLDNFARVTVSENGFRVEYFPTLAAARAADAESKKAKANGEPCCPFCRQSDQLRGIQWNHEHADGTGYFGPALICDRCDAVAPARVWSARGIQTNKG